MWICGIETTTRSGEVALLKDEKPAGVRSFEGQCAHAAGIFPSLRGLLRSCGIGPADVDLFVVDRGPGSYTGVRVGVAAAKVLAFALERPVVGVGLFEVIAQNLPSDLTAPAAACILDARLGQVYAALYELPERRPVFLNFVGSPEELLPRLPQGTVVFGDGIMRYSEVFGGFERGDADWARPRASVVARLGARRFLEQGAEELDKLTPLYLRLSVAEQKLRQREAEADGP